MYPWLLLENLVVVPPRDIPRTTRPGGGRRGISTSSTPAGVNPIMLPSTYCSSGFITLVFIFHRHSHVNTANLHSNTWSQWKNWISVALVITDTMSLHNNVFIIIISFSSYSFFIRLHHNGLLILSHVVYVVVVVIVLFIII